MFLTLGNGMLQHATMSPAGSAKNQTASLNPVEIDGVEYFTAADVAAVLKISRQTLWRWRRAGKIPLGHRFRDGQTFFTRNEVEEIKEFAQRIEPIDAPDRSQLELFKPRRS
jgi:Helix-turn-helix domain